MVQCVKNIVFIVVCAIALGMPTSVLAQTKAGVTLFAASSLTGILDDFITRYESADNAPTRVVFGASSQLSRQVERGAPADIVVMAHPLWAQKIAGTGTFDPPTAWLTSALVVAVRHLKEQTGLETLNAAARIATGDPAHVPLGLYAKQALETKELWTSLEPKIIASQNAGHAARLLQSDAVDAAILFKAQVSRLDTLKVTHQFEPNDHDPVVYQLFVKQGADEATLDLAALLMSKQAMNYFAANGFSSINTEASR